MFRLSKLLILVFTLIDIGDLQPIFEMDLINIESASRFGPFQANCKNVNVDFKITSNVKIYSGYLTTYVGISSNNYSYSSNSDTFSVKKDGATVINITLPTREYLTSNGMYIKMKFNYSTVFDGPMNKNITRSFVLYPIEAKKDIKPESYINEEAQNKNISYMLTIRSLISESESFKFPNYIDYFNIDLYHRLDLKSIEFTYRSNIAFSYSAAFLQIFDEDNAFPYIEKNEDDYFLIPLKVEQNGNKCTFAYKNKFYIHPITAQIAFEPKQDFTLTRYFYMPKNEKNSFVDKKMNIYLYGAGVGATNITWNLTYLANQNLLGDCSNSDYCIVGESKNG